MASTPANSINVSTFGVVFFGPSNFSVLAPGATGTVLTSTGTGTAPTWQALSGGISLGTFGSTPNANAATLSGGVLTLQPAGTSFPGGVSSGSQNFSGVKTFNSVPIITALTGVVTSDGASGLTASAITQYGTLVAGATNAVVSISPGTSGQFLVSNGSAANPSFQSVSPSGITTIEGDGSVSITGSTVKISGGNANGLTSAFVAVSGHPTEMALNFTDANFNQLLGSSIGLPALGSRNCSYGYGSFASFNASATDNVAYGQQSLLNGGGSFNISIGSRSGENYTDAGNESSNILFNSPGVIGDNNTLRIGGVTGSSTLGLNKAFICGINGVTSSNPMMVTINSMTDQLGVATIPSSPLVLVSSQVAGSSSSIIFTDLNVYSVYLMVITDCGPSVVNQQLEMLVSQNNGSTYLTSGYACGINYAVYNSATLTNVNSTTYCPISSSMFNSNTYSGTFYMFNANVGSPFNIQGSATWQDNSAGSVTGNYLGFGPTGVNAIKFQYASGDIASGTFTLYGLST